jgi:hypothetical protein
MAYFYITILEHRQGFDCPLTLYLHEREWPCYISLLLGMGLVTFNLLIGHPAIADPYLWTSRQNQIYLSYIRLSYVVAIMLILGPMLMGKFNKGMYLMSCSTMRSLGKLTCVNCIVSPIVISMLYDTGQESMFVSFNVVLYLGLGNALCCTVCSMMFLVFFEIPMAKVLSPIKKLVSHDQQLR